jgi:hypothetical protein
MSNANSIKVVARFRPQNRIEIESGGQPIVSFDGDDTCTIDVSALKTVSTTMCAANLLSVTVAGSARLVHV